MRSTDLVCPSRYVLTHLHTRKLACADKCTVPHSTDKHTLKEVVCEHIRTWVLTVMNTSTSLNVRTISIERRLNNTQFFSMTYMHVLCAYTYVQDQIFDIRTYNKYGNVCAAQG